MILDNLLLTITEECYDKSEVLLALLYGLAQALEDVDDSLDDLKNDVYISTSSKLYENFGTLLSFPKPAGVSDDAYRNQLMGIISGAVAGATVDGIIKVFDGLGLDATVYENFRYSQTDLFTFSVSVVSFGSYTEESLERILDRFKPAHTVGDVQLGGIAQEGDDYSYSASASSEYMQSYSDSFLNLDNIDGSQTTAYWKSSQDLFQLEEGDI
jgi:hypothetical protein